MVKTIKVPSIAADYNDHMNSVDISDQLRSTLGYDHRIRRGGWQAIAWTFLLDVILINSYILQLKGKPSWKSYNVQTSWRQQLIDALCERYGKTGGSRQRYRSGDEFTPLSQHNFVNRGKKSRCLACQGHRVGQPRSKGSAEGPLQPVSSNSLNRSSSRRAVQTVFGCDMCDVAICKSQSCWDFYHYVKPI